MLLRIPLLPFFQSRLKEYFVFFAVFSLLTFIMEMNADAAAATPTPLFFSAAQLIVFSAAQKMFCS